MKNFTEPRVAERQADLKSALDEAMRAIVQDHRDEIGKRSGLSFAALEVKKNE